MDMAAAEEGTKVGGELRGEMPPWGPTGRLPPEKGLCRGYPARGLVGGGVRAPRLAGDEVVRRSLGGGELVVGEDEDPRWLFSMLFSCSLAAKHITPTV